MTASERIRAVPKTHEWHEPSEPLPQSLVCGTCLGIIETQDES